MKERFLSVCLLTYKRNELLASLMDSFKNAERSETWELVIIDTTGEDFSKCVLERYEADFPVPLITHQTGDRVNISEGRNLALDIASADWILFMDDDQVIKPSDIKRVISKIKGREREFKAARLNLKTSLCPNSSGSRFEDKLRKSGFFIQHDPEEEKEIKACYLSTDGVIFKAPPKEMRFSPALGFTGGEDNDFFARYLGDKTCPIWNDIPITDHIVPERITLSYLMRDSFRQGASFYQLESGPLGKMRRVLFPKYIVSFLGGVMIFFKDVLLWKDWPKSLGLLVRQIGKISALMGVKYYHYQKNTT